MNERIEHYVSDLFRDAPVNGRIQEMREELLANMNERYADLLSQGKSEEDAYTTVVSGIGDIDQLISDISENAKQSFPDQVKQNRIGALLQAIAVMLYILSAAVIVLAEELLGQETLGLIIMLCMIAVATGLMVYGSSLKKKRYVREDDSFVEEYKERISGSTRDARLNAAISSAMWSIIVLLYFVFSFWTGRWDITWIIFLIGSVVQQVIYSIARKKLNIGGMIWTTALVAYFLVSFGTQRWDVSWVIFLAAAALQQVVRLARTWREL